jgi:phage baseplate assembly protein W
MSFVVQPNFRSLPQSWEMSTPFQINGSSGGQMQGPASTPGLNWSELPPAWDATVDYDVNQAVTYNNQCWVSIQPNTNTAPGTPLLDANGDPILDTNGNPIMPWSLLPAPPRWNPYVEYQFNDGVQYQSSAWYAVTTNINVVPGTDPTTWQLLPTVMIGTGAVAYDTDPVAWARTHILALCLTSPGERVMRPTYGVGLYRYVFEMDDPFVESQMVTAIQQGMSLWEPSITINACKLVPTPDFSGQMMIEIQFSVGNAPSRYTVNFSLGGAGVEVMS